MPVVRAALLALLAACATPSAGPSAAPERGTLLWEAKRDGGTTYVLGTVHGASTALALDPAVERAFAASDVLAIEVDPRKAAAAQQQLMLAAILPPDQTLGDLLSTETYRGILLALGKHGLQPQAVNRLRPWFAAMLLATLDLQAAGFDPGQGLEGRLLERQGDKELVELESVEAQLLMFDGLSAEVQEQLVSDAVSQSADATRVLKEIEAAWASGDAARVEELLFAGLRANPGARELYEVIFFRRNEAMAEAIRARHAAEKTHFVAVGAGHVVGARGIPALLKKAGFDVRQVPADQSR